MSLLSTSGYENKNQPPVSFIFNENSKEGKRSVVTTINGNEIIMDSNAQNISNYKVPGSYYVKPQSQDNIHNVVQNLEKKADHMNREQHMKILNSLNQKIKRSTSYSDLLKKKNKNRKEKTKTWCVVNSNEIDKRNDENRNHELNEVELKNEQEPPVVPPPPPPVDNYNIKRKEEKTTIDKNNKELNSNSVANMNSINIDMNGYYNSNYINMGNNDGYNSIYNNLINNMYSIPSNHYDINNYKPSIPNIIIPTTMDDLEEENLNSSRIFDINTSIVRSQPPSPSNINNLLFSPIAPISIAPLIPEKIIPSEETKIDNNLMLAPDTPYQLNFANTSDLIIFSPLSNTKDEEVEEEEKSSEDTDDSSQNDSSEDDSSYDSSDDDDDDDSYYELINKSELNRRIINNIITDEMIINEVLAEEEKMNQDNLIIDNLIKEIKLEIPSNEGGDENKDILDTKNEEEEMVESKKEGALKEEPVEVVDQKLDDNNKLNIPIKPEIKITFDNKEYSPVIIENKSDSNNKSQELFVETSFLQYTDKKGRPFSLDLSACLADHLQTFSNSNDKRSSYSINISINIEKKDSSISHIDISTPNGIDKSIEEIKEGPSIIDNTYQNDFISENDEDEEEVRVIDASDIIDNIAIEKTEGIKVNRVSVIEPVENEKSYTVEIYNQSELYDDVKMDNEKRKNKENLLQIAENEDSQDVTETVATIGLENEESKDYQESVEAVANYDPYEIDPALISTRRSSLDIRNYIYRYNSNGKLIKKSDNENETSELNDKDIDFETIITKRKSSLKSKHMRSYSAQITKGSYMNNINGQMDEKSISSLPQKEAIVNRVRSRSVTPLPSNCSIVSVGSRGSDNHSNSSTLRKYSDPGRRVKPFSRNSSMNINSNPIQPEMMNVNGSRSLSQINVLPQSNKILMGNKPQTRSRGYSSPSMAPPYYRINMMPPTQDTNINNNNNRSSSSMNTNKTKRTSVCLKKSTHRRNRSLKNLFSIFSSSDKKNRKMASDSCLNDKISSNMEIYKTPSRISMRPIFEQTVADENYKKVSSSITNKSPNVIPSKTPVMQPSSTPIMKASKTPILKSPSMKPSNTPVMKSPSMKPPSMKSPSLKPPSVKSSNIKTPNMKPQNRYSIATSSPAQSQYTRGTEMVNQSTSILKSRNSVIVADPSVHVNAGSMNPNPGSNRYSIANNNPNATINKNSIITANTNVNSIPQKPIIKMNSKNSISITTTKPAIKNKKRLSAMVASPSEPMVPNVSNNRNSIAISSINAIRNKESINENKFIQNNEKPDNNNDITVTSVASNNVNTTVNSAFNSFINSTSSNKIANTTNNTIVNTSNNTISSNEMKGKTQYNASSMKLLSSIMPNNFMSPLTPYNYTPYTPYFTPFLSYDNTCAHFEDVIPPQCEENNPIIPPSMTTSKLSTSFSNTSSYPIISKNIRPIHRKNSTSLNEALAVETRNIAILREINRNGSRTISKRSSTKRSSIINNEKVKSSKKRKSLFSRIF
ncbi:hypothetical protein BCR36DRAFT_87706 [Piromyces finnis]|uniref:Uncharacterized protein n=1 Tax=Piromyces finnis TaxID=1754191 RepID=A0A1Y1VLS9_9FUNG|nr:hypothetical protein BCR36DRAFT_87706 [Piromyces finnis]|eukprot:ORX59086.1 hypothetical protein BCR36DRAFT_87706 [Piromyces finnis]